MYKILHKLHFGYQEFNLIGTSATTISTTGYLTHQVSSTTITSNTYLPLASTTVTSGPQLVDIKFGQTGTATSGDVINIYSITMERYL